MERSDCIKSNALHDLGILHYKHIQAALHTHLIGSCRIIVNLKLIVQFRIYGRGKIDGNVKHNIMAVGEKKLL